MSVVRALIDWLTQRLAMHRAREVVTVTPDALPTPVRDSGTAG